MEPEANIPAVFKMLALVLGITGAVVCFAIGSYLGSAARDTELAYCRDKISETAPVWRHGTDKAYGGFFTIVSLDRGKHFYAATRKGDEIVILGPAEKIYPGVLKKLEALQQWPPKAVTNKRSPQG